MKKLSILAVVLLVSLFPLSPVKAELPTQTSVKHGERWFVFIDNATGLGVCALRYAIDVTFKIYSGSSVVQLNETYQLFCIENHTHQLEIQRIMITTWPQVDMMPDWNETTIPYPSYTCVPQSSQFKIHVVSSTPQAIWINRELKPAILIRNNILTYDNKTITVIEEQLPHNAYRYSITRTFNYPDPEIQYENKIISITFYTYEYSFYTHYPPSGYVYGLCEFNNLTVSSPPNIPLRQNLVLPANFTYVISPVFEEKNMLQNICEEVYEQYVNLQSRCFNLTRILEFKEEELSKYREIYLPLACTLSLAVGATVSVAVKRMKKQQKPEAN